MCVCVCVCVCVTVFGENVPWTGDYITIVLSVAAGVHSDSKNVMGKLFLVEGTHTEKSNLLWAMEQLIMHMYCSVVICYTCRY